MTDTAADGSLQQSGSGVAIRFRKLRADALAPVRAHPGDAGFDICAVEAHTLLPGERARVATGIAVALPDSYAGLILPRSGLAHRHGIALVNAPGLIDAGYRGELQVLLLNTDRHQTFEIAPGERIAQFMPVRTLNVEWTESLDEFDSSTRGTDGFGSTGR